MKSIKKTLFLVATIILTSTYGWTGEKSQDTDLINHIKKIHSSIYETFKHSEDDEIYNCLSASFMGEELDTQFYKFLKTIREFEKRGYTNHIQKIDYKKIVIEKKTDKDVKIYMKWKVFGTVKHELHEHDRCNTYEAVYNLKKDQKEKIFKIINTNIINGERIIYPKKYYDKSNILQEEEIVIEKSTGHL